MTSFQYKNYLVLYEIKNGKVVLLSAVADGNFTCSYGGKTFDPVEDLKKYIDSGVWDIGPVKR